MGRVAADGHDDVVVPVHRSSRGCQHERTIVGGTCGIVRVNVRSVFPRIRVIQSPYPPERIAAIILAAVLAIVVAEVHARYYIAYSFAASFVMWVSLRPPRRQYVPVLVTAVALWGLRLLHHESTGAIVDPPLQQLIYLTAAFVGAGSLLALAWFGPPDGYTFSDMDVAGVFVIAACGLSADVWFRYMTSHPLASLDRTLYAIDDALGGQPSFAAGRLLERLPALAIVCAAVYQWLPVWLVWMFVRLPRERVRLRLTWATAAAGTGMLGYLAYRLVPAAGPMYAFAALYPSLPPIVGPGWVQPMEMPTSLLNAFPSLHAAWALLLLAWAPALRTKTERSIVVVVAALTVLSTLGLGEHYVVDLIGAVPFTVALEALCTMTRHNWKRRLASAAISTGMFAAWIVAIRTGAILGLTPGAIRLAIVSTVMLSAVEPVLRLTRQRSHDRDGAPPVVLLPDLRRDALRRRS